MYEQYYGLKEKPFSLTPDPDFLFVNEQFREVLDTVVYGIQRHEGFTVIVGDVGTGKTTFCWALLSRLGAGIRTALILNPTLTEEDMLKAILQDYGIRPRGEALGPEQAEPPYDPAWMRGLTRKELIDELNFFLLQSVDQDLYNILVIDESQDLSAGVLEQIRLLSNLETAKKKLLQIIFVGQVEFEQKLQLPELRQLAQRITVRHTLTPLSRQDTARYIEHRLSVAGATRSVGFSRGALRRICTYSRGYPRLINIICDRSLLVGYVLQASMITSGMVRKAARGLWGNGSGAPRIRVVASRKVTVPIAALAVLALLAVLLFWGVHRALM
jgi:general secretion pathway protein A